MECDDRVKYVSGLVGRTHASPKGYAGQRGNKMTILEDKVEEIIKEVCDEFGVDVARLKAGDRGRGTMYTPARVMIAERLIANCKMPISKIADLTGVTSQAIYYMLDREKKKTKPEKTTDAVDILHKRYIGDDPERRASLQAEREKKPVTRNEQQATSNTVTIDFTERTELFKHLVKYAKEEIRSVEDQIVYFIQNQLSFEEAHTDGN